MLYRLSCSLLVLLSMHLTGFAQKPRHEQWNEYTAASGSPSFYTPSAPVAPDSSCIWADDETLRSLLDDSLVLTEATAALFPLGIYSPGLRVGSLVIAASANASLPLTAQQATSAILTEGAMPTLLFTSKVIPYITSRKKILALSRA